MSVTVVKLTPLDGVVLDGPIKDLYTDYTAAVKLGKMPPNAARLPDYRRWTIVQEQIKGFKTILDVGIGLGQFVNAAGRSGWFSSVIGADRRPHSGLIKEASVHYETLSLTSTRFHLTTLRSEVVTCLEVLEHLTNTGLKRAIDNLRMFASRRLIVTVPYYEEERPEFHKQMFTVTRLQALFPDGEITLIAEKRTIRWAMVVVNFEQYSND